MGRRFSLHSVSVFLIIFLIFSVLIYSNAFIHVRSVLADRFYGGRAVLDNVVIVKIDDSSIQKIGRWPWSRDVFAALLEKVKTAKVVGVDVSFFEPSKNDAVLRDKIGAMNNVVLASEIVGGVLYRPIFAGNFGYVNILTDDDGVTRSVDFSAQQSVFPFAFEIYKKAWGNAVFSAGIKNINFASQPNSFKSYSVYDVLENDYDFGNKLVIIGATAPDLHDSFFVPTSEGVAMAGVEIHANILQNLILNNFVVKQSDLTILFIVLLVGFVSVFFVSHLKARYAALFVFLILGFYLFAGVFAFSHFDYLFDLFFVPLSLIIFTGAGAELNYLEQKKETMFITNAFGKYISKNVLNQIISRKHSLQLGGDKRTITIFFSDIRGFTTISEKLTPEQLVSLLNEYLSAMTNIILEHQGTLDKFIGDAVMAFWNAPLPNKEHAKLACNATLAQIRAVKELQKGWVDKGLPVINIGCGLNTGDAIIGNMGSHDRFDYTAIGDTVNLGSRLEGLTKTYGVHIIISESTYALVKNDFNCRKLDAVKVKGKKIPVKIYELCTEYEEKFAAKYEQALELYFQRKFKNALQLFEDALLLKKDDVSCILFIARCKDYVKSPPPKDWDGSYEMKTK